MGKNDSEFNSPSVKTDSRADIVPFSPISSNKKDSNKKEKLGKQKKSNNKDADKEYNKRKRFIKKYNLDNTISLQIASETNKSCESKTSNTTAHNKSLDE